MGWVLIMLVGMLALAAALGGGLYDGWLHHRHVPLAGWSDADRDHARIMSRYYAHYGPTQ